MLKKGFNITVLVVITYLSAFGLKDFMDESIQLGKWEVERGLSSSRYGYVIQDSFYHFLLILIIGLALFCYMRIRDSKVEGIAWFISTVVIFVLYWFTYGIFNDWGKQYIIVEIVGFIDSYVIVKLYYSFVKKRRKSVKKSNHSKQTSKKNKGVTNGGKLKKKDVSEHKPDFGHTKNTGPINWEN